MSVVIPFGRFLRRTNVPPLLFVEMFEYQLDGPIPRRSEQVQSAIESCRVLLEHARSQGWPIGFTISLSRTQRTKGAGLGWIEGFQPRRGDMVFETSADTCYSSTEFAEAMTNMGNSFLLAGFSGERVCLATLIDAPRHGHNAGLVEDATCVRQLNGLGMAESHRALVAVASNHATVLTSREWLHFGGTPRPTVEPCYDRS